MIPKKDDISELLGIKVKTIAGEIKQTNGNKGINQSDMMWYLIQKTDSTHLLIMDIQKDINDSCVNKEHCKELREKIKNNNDNKFKEKVFTKDRMVAGVTAIIAMLALIITMID